MRIKQILPYLLQPFLIAFFPIMRIYTFNIGEIPILHLFFAFITILAITSLVFFTTSLIYKNFTKGSFFTSLFFISFYSLDLAIRHILKPIIKKTNIQILDIFRVKHLLIISLLILIFVAIKIYKTNNIKLFRTKTLFIFLTTLYSITIIQVIIEYRTIAYKHNQTIIRYNKQNEQFQKKLSQCARNIKKRIATKNMPDIYFIVLDAYPTNKHLLEYFNYDNSDFTNKLRKLKFNVLQNSLSNYNVTLYSLPSILNMNYLPDNIEYITQIHMWENNNVEFFLKELGYKTISYKHHHQFPSQSHKKISFVGYLKKELNEFFFGNFNLVHRFFQWNAILSQAVFIAKIKTTSEKTLRFNIKQKLSILKQLPLEAGPKFIYMHLVCPHTPHIFTENGDIFSSSNSSLTGKEQFVQSVKFINKEIPQIIQTILAKSTNPPIIMIQGDHSGWASICSSTIAELDIDFKKANSMIQKNPSFPFEILFACHFPNKQQEDVNPNLTSVNGFRFIFNHYFNINLELLKDKFFFFNHKENIIPEIKIETNK
jgi:hypothetical protein